MPSTTTFSAPRDFDVLISNTSVREAREGHRAAVLAYAPLAAAEASKLGAHRVAASHYARALRHGEDLPARELANTPAPAPFARVLLDRRAGRGDRCAATGFGVLSRDRGPTQGGRDARQSREASSGAPAVARRPAEPRARLLSFSSSCRQGVSLFSPMPLFPSFSGPHPTTKAPGVRLVAHLNWRRQSAMRMPSVGRCAPWAGGAAA